MVINTNIFGFGLNCEDGGCGGLAFALLLPYILGFFAFVGLILIGLALFRVKGSARRLLYLLLGLILILPGTYTFLDFNFLSKRRDAANNVKLAESINFDFYKVTDLPKGFELKDVSIDSLNTVDLYFENSSSSSVPVFHLTEYAKPSDGDNPKKCFSDYAIKCEPLGNTPNGYPLYDDGFELLALVGDTVIHEYKTGSYELSKDEFIKIVDSSEKIDKANLQQFVKNNQY